MKLAPIIFLALFAGTAAVAAPTPTSADRAFVAKVSQGGMFEVAAGRLAAQKGSTQDIRDFGAMEEHDHVLVGDRLTATSHSEGMRFSTSLNPDFTAKMERLQSLSGPAFDVAYMGEMASLHAADGAAFAQEAQDGGSAAFRAFGAETHLIVQRHIGAIQAVTPPG